METASRNPAAPLTPAPGSALERLLADPYRFDFFQAVRVLARAARAEEADAHGAVGFIPVRFRAAPGFGFPASPIAAVRELREENGRAAFEVAITFLGLTGPSGVLPPHYTETLLRLGRDPDPESGSPLRDWFDLFNHRMTALFYLAWAKYRPDLACERAARAAPPRECEFTTAYLSLIGLGTPGLRGRVRPPAPRPAAAGPSTDLSLISYSGLLARGPRTAAGLEAILAGYLGAAVRVFQFVGRWLPLPEAAQSCLGRANVALGRDTVVGRRIRDHRAVRVRIGPLTGEQFAALTPPPAPDADSPFARLVRLVRFYLGAELDFDVLLVPAAAAVVPARTGSAPAGTRLGRNGWLRAAPFHADPEDAHFREDLAQPEPAVGPR